MSVGTGLSTLRTVDFDFELPPDLIAQIPIGERDKSRLLVLHRCNGRIEHRGFGSLLEYLQPGDVLVLNDSRVICARLRGTNSRTGGEFEVLLLQENVTNDWWAMLRPGKRGRVGTEILFRAGGSARSGMSAVVIEVNQEGHRRLRFSGAPHILDELEHLGEVPLPPYIRRRGTRWRAQDRERYQTVYAQLPGSIAAPTAGLHFTHQLLNRLRSRGVRVCFLTLHVGLGTFAPVKTETIEAHTMHEERYSLREETANSIREAKRAGKRVIAVGTTTLRVLESIAAENAGALVAGSGRTRIFIYPPYDFKIVDSLVTNFHLPRSTLLMLVSAFAAPNEVHGRETVLSAYAEAIGERYRFFSYGDAMLLL